MSQKTITTYLCDPCLANGDEVEASATHSIQVDRYGTKVDLCPRHDAAVMDALRVLLEMRGDRTLVCPDCGFMAKAAVGLSAHARARHGGQRLRIAS